MKTTTFANRHIGIGEEELPLMLKKIGVSSLDELIEKTIPANILLKESLKLGAAMTEREFAEHIGELAAGLKAGIWITLSGVVLLVGYLLICHKIVKRTPADEVISCIDYPESAEAAALAALEEQTDED